ncbi:MAG: hypothetical protein RIQ54_381 [Candidatus Parcubacteria bacterium]|jgi:hypothetical protein
MNTALARKINSMVRQDQKIRNSHKKGARLSVAIEKKHVAELKCIIKKYGWPTISLVGKKASFGAWLLAQHADHDSRFQKTVLKLLQKINQETQDINPAHIAYLADRLLIKRKKINNLARNFILIKMGTLCCILLKIKKEYTSFEENIVFLRLVNLLKRRMNLMRN